MLKFILGISNLPRDGKEKVLKSSNFKNAISNALPINIIVSGAILNFGTKFRDSWGLMTVAMVRHPFQRFEFIPLQHNDNCPIIMFHLFLVSANVPRLAAAFENKVMNLSLASFERYRIGARDYAKEKNEGGGGGVTFEGFVAYILEKDGLNERACTWNSCPTNNNWKPFWSG